LINEGAVKAIGGAGKDAANDGAKIDDANFKPANGPFSK